MFGFIRKSLKTNRHHPRLGGLEILKYIGPGLLVTVGFIDPGNWASNLAAGADYGYALLWMVSLSTVMLIILQHNVAHLGIVTGLCLSEAAVAYLKPRYAKLTLFSAMGASVSTSLAEIFRRGYRFAHAISYSGQNRGGDNLCRSGGYAFHQ